MKILIIGCGSIGARHAKNAVGLGHEVFLADQDPGRAEVLAKEISAKSFYKDYKQALKQNPDIEAGVIAVPTSLHAQIALDLIDAGKHVFMEKPLASSLEEAHEVEDLLRVKKVVFMMGQSYRFHEGFLELKKILNEQAIGKIFHVNYFGGQYLPDWHPDQDYRKEYAAQRKLGGGVLNTSMSHSFDIVQWLFGNVTELCGWKAKLGNLDIDVDDSVFCLMKTEKNIVIECQSDFLNRISEHAMIITGELGTINADFISHSFIIKKPENKEQTTPYSFDGNKRYIEEIKYFINLIQEKKYTHDLDIQTGIKVMELMNSKNIRDLM
jgi:predicted dehydrogenase